MIKELVRLVEERLKAARQAPDSLCRACAVEELEEVLSMAEELGFIYDEEIR